MSKRRPYNPQYARPYVSRRSRIDDAIESDMQAAASRTRAYETAQAREAAQAAGAEPKTETKAGDE